MGYIVCLPFDQNPDGTDQLTTEEYGMRWARDLASSVAHTGLVAGPSVTSAVGSGTFRLGAGAHGLIRGYYWEVIADGTSAYVETQQVASSNYVRQWRAMITLDRTANTITFTAVQGPAGGSIPPDPRNGPDTYDLPLARGTVAATSTSITGLVNDPVWATEPPGVAAVSASEDTDLTTTSTGYSPGTAGAWCSVVFVAPRSGAVSVSVGAYLSATTGATAVAGFEIRAGASVGSGSVIVSPTGYWSVQNKGTVPLLASSAPNVVRGLTPGSTYNSRVMHAITGAGTGSVGFRSLTVVPVP